MKKKTIILIAAATLLAFILSFPCFARNDGMIYVSDAVLTEVGVTEWQYATLTPERFAEISDTWYMDGTVALDGVYSGTFGDRINPPNCYDTGWRRFHHDETEDGIAVDYHVLLVRTAFEIDDLEAVKNMHLFADFFYDNTLRVYLNDVLIAADDYWNDRYELYDMDDFMYNGFAEVYGAVGWRDAIKSGTNELEISLADDAGGREFALNLFLSESDHPSLTDPAPDPDPDQDPEPDPEPDPDPDPGDGEGEVTEAPGTIRKNPNRNSSNIGADHTPGDTSRETVTVVEYYEPGKAPIIIAAVIGLIAVASCAAFALIYTKNGKAK